MIKRFLSKERERERKRKRKREEKRWGQPLLFPHANKKEKKKVEKKNVGLLKESDISHKEGKSNTKDKTIKRCFILIMSNDVF